MLVTLGLVAVAVLSQQIGHSAHSVNGAGPAVSAGHAAVDLVTVVRESPGGTDQEHRAPGSGASAEHVCTTVLLEDDALRAPSAAGAAEPVFRPTPITPSPRAGEPPRVASPGTWDTPGVLLV